MNLEKIFKSYAKYDLIVLRIIGDFSKETFESSDFDPEWNRSYIGDVLFSAVCMIGISITLAHIWAHIEFLQVKTKITKGQDSAFF